MAIPDFQSFMLPLLRFASDGKEHTMQEARDALAKEFKLSEEDLAEFVGALHGKQAKKGIFITTSSFSKEARDYAEMVDSKVVLIDGEYLSQLMINHNVGVSTIEAYEIKKIDSDYFFEE